MVSKIINSTKIIIIFINYDRVRKRILWFSRSVMVYFIFRIRRRKFSFTCSTDLQNFRSCFKKFKANLPLPFGFKCKPFCPRCSALMLLLSMHSNSKFSRCLLTFRIVRFGFPWSFGWGVLIKWFYSLGVVSRCLFLTPVNRPQFFWMSLL